MEKNFKPTVAWMNEKYNEMNNLLFNGKLDACDFTIFTTGKGSQGRTLGWFCMKGKNLKGEQYTRKMFVYINVSSPSSFLPLTRKEYINKNNFYELCKPLIGLNGNYRGTEQAFLTTLVHEMCHYYTYMNGYAPTQAHGREFKYIAEHVTSQSNGVFSIQRLATAEQMTEFELNDEMKQKKEKRRENKKSRLNAVLVYYTNGVIGLTTTTKQSLIDEIMKSYTKNNVKKVVFISDPIFINYIFDLGYQKNFSTWRYWDIANKPWINIIDKVMTQELINPNIKENQYNTKQIIREVIDEFMKNNAEDDVIDITPNMNLGLTSPFELV